MAAPQEIALEVRPALFDVLARYAGRGELTYAILRSAWTDAGSFESLFRATVLMQKLEQRALIQRPK